MSPAVRLTDDEQAALAVELSVLDRLDAADSSVAVAVARERLAAAVARRAERGEGGPAALPAALIRRAQAIEQRRAAVAARRLLLDRLVRMRRARSP